MSRPLQTVSHSDPGRLAHSQSTEACDSNLLEARHRSHLAAQENVPVACFDPPLEVDMTRKPAVYNQKAADPLHPDLASLLVKNKTLFSELRNLQSKLFMKETSLQEMKTELESYKESNAQQSLQITSLRDDVRNLQDLIASLMKIKILKNTNSQNLGRGNWDLTEQVIDLENRLREYLVEREKAEILEKRHSYPSRLSPYIHLKGPEESLDIFPVKDNGEASNFERDNIVYSEGPIDGQNFGDKCQQDLIHKEKLTFELDRPPHSCRRDTTAEQSHHQNFLAQLATLLSDSIGPILATEESVKERIQEMGINEQLWKSRSEALQQEIQKLTKRLEQLYYLYEEAVEGLPQAKKITQSRKDPSTSGRKGCCQPLSEELRRGQDKSKGFLKNSKMAAAPRMEEKIQRLQKQLSDLKLSNKNMKTQLTRVNVLKDKTIERLRQSVAKAETLKEKTAAKTDNLKTTADTAEEVVKSKERAQPKAARDPPELPTVRSTLKGVSGREQELTDFRETIMKMLGFNLKTADKEVINQLKLVIQVYEISSRSKMASHQEAGQDK